MSLTPNNILALDVGGQRIGVAVASGIARLASPFMTIQNTDDVWQQLRTIIDAERIGTIVVGLPRSLDGNETEQTKMVRLFVAQLAQRFSLPIVLQDEALTSKKARAELHARGKSFAKGDIDALAATYILEDYLLITEGAKTGE